MTERILISDLVRNSLLLLTNQCRLLRLRHIGYVALNVSGSFPERTSMPRRRFPMTLLPWPVPPPSVQAFCEALERLAVDPRVEGIVLRIHGLDAGPATLSSLRQAIGRFRESHKQAIAYVHDLDMWTYYLACACDRVLAPESASFQAAGLRSEAIFLRDTLAGVGIQADFEAIAEYKVSPDTFRRSAMTEPHREMLESLVGSIYAEAIGAMADGRRLTAERVQQLLDSVPLTAHEALDVGLLDAVCYEDELPSVVGSPQQQVTLITWEQARRHLVQPRRWRSRYAVGVVSVEGVIVPGPSRQPPVPLPLPLPVPGEQAGSETVIQQLRVARSKRIAAIILHVDSPGGSALASDLIWREVAQLKRTKPIVVYMGNRAASGGYYVSAPANAIVAQPSTLTGSIGIWGGKIVTARLFKKLHARREVVSRGKAAGLFADTAPFTDEERARVRAEIAAGYARFKSRVAEGRGKTDEEVEAVARGRVWTGEQALACGLIDSLGDLYSAAKKACELAGLDPRRYVPLVNIAVPRQYLLPLAKAGAGEWTASLLGLLREGVWALAPWSIRFRG